MSVQAPLDENDPRMKAWREYIATAEFENSLNWAKAVDVHWEEGSNAILLIYPHLDGSLWGVFIAGFEAGRKSSWVSVRYQMGAIMAELLKPETMAGNLTTVIDEIVKVAPELEERLQSTKDSVAFTAPEYMYERWNQLAAILSHFAADHPERELIAKIFASGGPKK